MKKDVSIEIIQKCPNLCLHCSSRSFLEAEEVIDYQTICKVVDDLKNLGTQRICLSGGEPFLHPDIIDIISYIDKNNIEVNIYSCGVIIEDHAAKELPEELLINAKHAGLKKIMFNLQSVKEDIYDMIVGKTGRLPFVTNSIKRTNECGIKTEIHFVPMKLNFMEIEDVIDYASELNVECVSFLKLVPHGRAGDNKKELILDDKELEYVKNRLHAHQNNKSLIRVGIPLSKSDGAEKCHAVNGKIYIKYNGDVFGCEAFKYLSLTDESGNEAIPDNIYDSNISDIYHNSKFLKSSKKLIRRYSGTYSNCDTCPVQKYLREEVAEDDIHD